MVQMASVGSGVQIDHSKLAQTEKLIADIKKQLDVAERVLAHKAKFVDPIPLETTVNEKELLGEVDAYLNPQGQATQQATAGSRCQSLWGYCPRLPYEGSACLPDARNARRPRPGRRLGARHDGSTGRREHAAHRLRRTESARPESSRDPPLIRRSLVH